MPVLTALQLTGGVILLLANAFYVATEFALTRLRQYDPSEFEDDPRLAQAWKMTEELEIYLTTCQVGITFTSILLGIVAEPAVTRLLEPVVGLAGIPPTSTHFVSIVVGIALINLAHTVWGEQAPTYLGVEKAKFVAKYCAQPLYYWSVLMHPLITLGDRMTRWTLKLFGISITRSWTQTDTPSSRAEIRSELTALLKSGDMPEDRQQEVLQTLKIDEIPTADIMVPRDKVVPLSTELSFEDNLKTVQTHMQDRYPLVEGSLEEYKGVVYASEILGNIELLLEKTLTLDDLDRSNLEVPHDLPVSKLIDTFQEHSEELAMVTQNSHTIGLVTLTDAVETIVGNLQDPLDLETMT